MTSPRASYAGLALCLAALLACDGGGGDGGGGPDAGPGGGSRTVTVTSPGPLDWGAYRDGQGTWRPLDDPAGNNRFQVQAATFTLAFVCKDTAFGEVIQAQAGEVSAVRVPCGDPLAFHRPAGAPIVRHPWTGVFNGARPESRISVIFGAHQVPLPARVTSSGYTIDLEAGTYDLVALEEPPGAPSRVLIVRAVVVGGPGSTDLDFRVGALAPVDQAMAAASSNPDELVEAGLQLTTARGATVSLTSPGPLRVPVFPPGTLAADDTQQVWVNGLGAAGAELRGSLRTIDGAEAPAAGLPAALAEVMASLAGSGPAARPRVTFQPHPNALFYQLTAGGLAPGGFLWVVNTSARTLGAARALELPDLAALPGFDPAWALSPGLPLLVELTAVASNRPMDVLLDGLTGPQPGEATTFSKTVRMLPAAAP